MMDENGLYYMRARHYKRKLDDKFSDLDMTKDIDLTEEYTYLKKYGNLILLLEQWLSREGKRG